MRKVVTMDEAPSITSVIGMRVASLLVRHSQRKARIRPRTWIQTLVRIVMHIAGFACLTISAWSINFTAGIAAAGISCFVLSWLNNGSSTTDDSSSQSTMHSR